MYLSIHVNTYKYINIYMYIYICIYIDIHPYVFNLCMYRGREKGEKTRQNERERE